MADPPVINTNEGIVNLALHHLGAEPISSFNDDSKAGELARNSYSLHRDVLLRAFTWNFAIRRIDLSASETDLGFDFANAYDVPADWLRTLRVQGEESNVWNMEGRRILTNAASPIKLKYLALIDVSLWDPMFKSCLAAKLAMYWSEPLTKQGTISETMTRLFVEELKQAISTDSIEKIGTKIVADEWLLARATGTQVRLATGTPQPL